jgi:hypothetical protein
MLILNKSIVKNVLFCSIVALPQIKAENPTVINIFVHGSVGAALNLLGLKKQQEILRKNPKNSALRCIPEKEGLLEINLNLPETRSNNMMVYKTINALDKMNKNVYPKEKNKYFVFGWSGRYSYKDYDKECLDAAKRLHTAIIDINNYFKPKRFCIICHSQGGNVGLNLAHINAKTEKKIPNDIVKLVMYGTPKTSNSEFLANLPFWKSIYNIVSKDDIVEKTGTKLSKKSFGTQHIHGDKRTYNIVLIAPLHAKNQYWKKIKNKESWLKFVEKGAIEKTIARGISNLFSPRKNKNRFKECSKNLLSGASFLPPKDEIPIGHKILGLVDNTNLPTKSIPLYIFTSYFCKICQFINDKNDESSKYLAIAINENKNNDLIEFSTHVEESNLYISKNKTDRLSQELWLTKQLQ